MSLAVRNFLPKGGSYCNRLARLDRGETYYF